MKILLVEDKLDTSTPLKKSLEGAISAVEVRLASSMKGGIEEFKRFAPDVVMLDADLPDSGPMDTMKRIREFLPAQVVATSAYDEEGLVTAAFENGATDFIVKGLHSNIPQRIIFAHLRKIYAPNK